MHFKKYFLLYTLIPLLILSIAVSYFRFMVIHDYIVEYQGDCNPAESSCFVECEDEECTTEYYYSYITKNASDLIEQCGPDITDCEFAQICLPKGDGDCSITYCNPVTDGDICVTGGEEETGQVEPIQNSGNLLEVEPNSTTELSV